MGRGKHVKFQEEEEGKVAGKESFVEIHRLYVDENVKYLSRAQTDAYCVANQRLILGQKEAPKILKAISVTARVIDSAGVNAYGFLERAVVGRAAVF